MKIPNSEQIVALHKKYASSKEMFDLVYQHCAIDTEIALWCARNYKKTVNLELLRAACMLHDIGSYGFLHNSFNRDYYLQHAILGAKILSDEGIDKNVASLVETHVELGLSKNVIINKKLMLPPKDYVPSTIEGRILCYADRFHSKQPIFNSYSFLLKNFEKEFPEQTKKFKSWSVEFGIPDTAKLAKKYNHPVR